MRKRLYFLIALLSFAITTMAQIAENAAGLRFGAGTELGTEITFQHHLNSNHRLEVDLGFNSSYEYVNDFRHDYNSWALFGLYHWVWKLDFQEGFSWYAGPGAKLGTWSSNLVYDSRYISGIFLAAAGDVGIEYSFPARIQFALNARPELGLLNHGSGLNIGFAVRYLFK